MIFIGLTFFMSEFLLRTCYTPKSIWSVSPSYHVGKELSPVWSILFSPIPDCQSRYQHHIVTGKENMKTQVKDNSSKCCVFFLTPISFKDFLIACFPASYLTSVCILITYSISSKTTGFCQLCIRLRFI